MSLQSQDGDKFNEEGESGHVGRRMISEVKLKGEKSVPFSWALDDEQFVPIQDASSKPYHIQSPPRYGSQRSRRQGTPSSKVSTLDGDFSLPPEMNPGNEKKDVSFKSWLTSGVLDVLNTAAGVTISTTGQLMAPPMLVTKNFLLPGLLALFVDTLDATAPQRLKDWFRVLSSSAYHLFLVLRSTSSGQKFSSQLIVVLKDALVASSSPETRQVLVDGMACSVKLADALNTPEVDEWMDHVVLLGCRLVDAASSGKVKSFLHDIKDLAWNGIEMATDPATTLALAEVTAHLCYALEDAQRVLEPNKRSQRNQQNQATYLDPLQMSDLSNQVSMENIILSCLGKYEDGDLGSEQDVPSNVVLGKERSATHSHMPGWKDRRDNVNVQLLKEKIFTTSRSRPRGNSHSSEGSLEKSIDSSLDSSHEILPIIPSEDPKEEGNDLIQSKEIKEESTGPYGLRNTEDMEDIASNKTLASKKTTPSSSKVPHINLLTQDQSTKEPAVRHFYSMLDDLLEKNRTSTGTEKPCQRKYQRVAVDEDSLKSLYERKESWKLLKAKVKRLKEGATKRAHARGETRRENKRIRFQHFPLKQKISIVLAAVVMLAFFLLWLCFGLYGIYTFAKIQLRWEKMSTTNSQATTVPPMMANNAQPYTNSEVFIRIIREVVHVGEDGSIIKESTLDDSILSTEKMDSVVECVTSQL